MAIQSFRCSDTEALFNGRRVARFVQIRVVAMRKLAMLDAAGRTDDLKIPPGNRLELLSGNLAGRYSIRINVQWRIVFRWTPAGPVDVEIVDYH